MDKLLFYLKHNVIDCFRFKKYKDYVKTSLEETSKRTGIPVYTLRSSMKKCAYAYKGNFEDFFNMEMFSRSFEENAGIITLGTYYEYILGATTDAQKQLLAGKNSFNSHFKNFLGRDWMRIDISSNDEFEAFIKEHQVIVAKPLGGSGGTKVERLNSHDFETVGALKEYLLSKRMFLVEECIEQDEEFAAFNPPSINTMRMFTIMEKGKPFAVAALIRMGTGTGVTDNIFNGGLAAAIDIDSGEIVSNGFSKLAHVSYENHPVTNHRILGFTLPRFKEITSYVCEAAKLIPDVKMVGWDVAVSKKGVVIVEANATSDHILYYYLYGTKSKEKFVDFANRAGVIRNKFAILR